MPKPHRIHPDIPGFTPETLALQAGLSGGMEQLAETMVGDCSLACLAGDDTLWIVVTRPKRGGFALRAAPSLGRVSIKKQRSKKNQLAFTLESAAGVFSVAITTLDDHLFRVTTRLTPAADLLLPFWPRDLYPLDANWDPTKPQGWVEAAQRGVNSGLCYFCIEKPAFGATLYFQNLTALNSFFQATKTKPDGVVGGEWPELGYQPPTAPLGNSPPTDPLPQGVEVTISDAFLAIAPACDLDERASAARFLQLLGDIYPHLEKPSPNFHDWTKRATKTLRDLGRSPKATIAHYGARYIRPYTDAEYPDSMVQMTVLAAMREYADAMGEEPPLYEELRAGIGRFYDKELGAIRRYLPNVGDDKDADAVDSWYLYHPLMNLARLAKAGDALARRLFEDSLGYAVKAAHHFKYKWPIQYNVKSLAVITAARNGEGLGQTDVGGLYAFVMLQAYELTEDETYLSEAKTAIRATREMRFELAYQTNLTAWGALACLKLWKLEQDRFFLDQAYVFVASFLHNCEIWESEIEHARHYANFLGATCLHDAPYMAAYECFESAAAFEEFLRLGGEEIMPAARTLLCDYYRYAFDRAWFYYPDALPKAILADKVRNGHIDCALSFPLEDLYGDGQPPGQVGQEIYGCGGAFTFAARAFHRLKRAPFTLFCDVPAIVEEMDAGQVVIRLLGSPQTQAQLRVMGKGRAEFGRVSLASADGETIPARRRGKRFRVYDLPAHGAFELSRSETA